MSKYNIILQEELPELKTETGDIVQKEQPQLTLDMVFPVIYGHYIKAKNEIMNLMNIEECINLAKVITSGKEISLG